MFAASIVLFIAWWDAGDTYCVRRAVALSVYALFVYFLIFCWNVLYRIVCISSLGEALRMRPRPSRLARNNYDHAHMRHDCSHQLGNRYVARRPRALPGAEAASLVEASCALSGRGWCAPGRVCGRAARSGGRAGRACWSLVTSWRHGSGCSKCCGPMMGHSHLSGCFLGAVAFVR